MINFYNQVPTIYNNASRDFQYLSNLINIVLNSVKHNVDDLYILPNVKADKRLVELLAMTLGFKVKRNYDKNQLIVLVSILPSVLKYKGSKKAVDLAIDALMAVSGISDEEASSEIKNGCLEIMLPEIFSDRTLLMDLLPYIMPAGLTVRFKTKTVLKPSEISDINVGYKDNLHATWFADARWNHENNNYEGVSYLYEAEKSDAHFTNYKNTDNQIDLNVGLLDSAIIPALLQPLYDESLYTKDTLVTIKEGE